MNRPNSPIVGKVERMLLQQAEDDEVPRSQDILHVSELSRSDFCPRAAYYRISGAPLLVPAKENSARLQAIFEEGHDVHAKWQRWIRRLGVLYGRWKCQVCGHIWLGTSPTSCPGRLTLPRHGEPYIAKCHATKWQIIYLEVPLYNKDLNLGGSGDGQLDNEEGPWVEIKTIGQGTVRQDAPSLLKEHTYKVVEVADRDEPLAKVRTLVDLDTLWKDLRSPFPSHLRQGNIYCALAGVDQCIFVYEFKPNQARKDFVVKASPRIYEPLLQKAEDLKWCVDHERTPPCPWDGCAQCRAYEKESDVRATTPRRSTQFQSAADRAARRADRVEGGRSAPPPRSARAIARPSAGVRAPADAVRRNRTGGPGPDGAVPAVSGLGGLLRRASVDR